MIKLRIFGIVFVVGLVASITTVTTISLHNAMASVLAGFDINTGNVYTSDADIDVAEAAEAENAAVNNQTADENETFLSIQAAQSGSLSELNATTYSLELNDVSDKTILFSDRPGRFVTTLPTSDFVGDWTTGPNSFQSDPPNAALVLDEPTAQDVTIVELFNPLYNGDNKTLQYDVNPIGNITSTDLPSEFQQSTLVIDVSGEGAYICDGACWK
jgi:hypothetical protein